MRDAFYEYEQEHPEELNDMYSLLQASEEIEIVRQKKIAEKLKLIQQCREEIKKCRNTQHKELTE